jgi:hypothetical protein
MQELYIRKWIIRTAIAFCLFTCIYASWIYLTEFYYHKPSYTLGTKNATLLTLHNVTIRLLPEGQNLCGILDPGQEDHYMDPRWPVPKMITVNFQDEQGTTHQLSLQSNLTKAFHGKLTVVISRTNDMFAAKLIADSQ